MNGREWSLIAFTLLGQLSVGAVLFLGGAQLVTTRTLGPDHACRTVGPALIVVTILFGLGLAASLFHLGDPWGAALALANLRRSWLSREVLLALLFGLGLIGLTVAVLTRPAGAGAINILGMLTAALGVSCVLAMSQIYRLPAQPAWNSLATPASFLLTTLILGAALTTLLLAWRAPAAGISEPGMVENLRTWRALAGTTATLGALLVGAQLVLQPAHLLILLSSGQGLNAMGATVSEILVAFVVRLALAFAGGALLLLCAYRTAKGDPAAGVPFGFATLAFAVVLAGEAAGRYLFYAMRLDKGLL